MWMFQLLARLPSLPSSYIRLNEADHLVQTQHDKFFMKAVKFVMYEKIREGSWGVCNPQEGFRLAWTGGMFYIHFNKYISEVDWPSTWPQERADVVYLRCSPTRVCVPHSHLSQRPSNISLSSSGYTRTLPRWGKVLPEVSEHPYYQWRQACSVANDHLCCRALRDASALHCLVVRWKDLCFHFII